jgi:predicted nucleotidyltransferase
VEVVAVVASAALAVAAPAAAEPEAAGSEEAVVVPEKQDKLINEFVSRLKQAAGENLQSVVLYGSAASGEFDAEFSNVNLLCILRQTSFAELQKLSSAVEWWTRQKNTAPLVLTREELERSADVFSIEWLDMQQNHRLLFGDDPVQALRIPMNLHRAQVEYELREKMILLRQRLLHAANQERVLWDLLLRSVMSFGALFRHALIALGDTAPRSKREAVQALASRAKIDPQAFMQLLDIREHKLERKQLDVNDICTRYLAAIEQVTLAVDTMLDSVEPRGA